MIYVVLNYHSHTFKEFGYAEEAKEQIKEWMDNGVDADEIEVILRDELTAIEVPLFMRSY